MLLTNCKIIKFYINRVKGNCSLKSEFILFDEKLDIKLHLGILKNLDDFNIYIPETFIIKKLKDRDKDRFTHTIPKQEFKNIIEREIIIIHNNH